MSLSCVEFELYQYIFYQKAKIIATHIQTTQNISQGRMVVRHILLVMEVPVLNTWVVQLLAVLMMINTTQSNGYSSYQKRFPSSTFDTVVFVFFKMLFTWILLKKPREKGTGLVPIIQVMTILPRNQPFHYTLLRMIWILLMQWFMIMPPSESWLYHHPGFFGARTSTNVLTCCCGEMKIKSEIRGIPVKLCYFTFWEYLPTKTKLIVVCNKVIYSRSCALKRKGYSPTLTHW